MEATFSNLSPFLESETNFINRNANILPMENGKVNTDSQNIMLNEKKKKQLSFWTRKLIHMQHKSSVIISLWDKDSKQVRAGFGEIIRGIMDKCSAIRIKGISAMENSLFYYIVFEEESDKITCISNIREIHGNDVVYMNKSHIQGIVEIKIFWLPPDMDLKIVSNKLNSILKIKEIKPTLIEIKGIPNSRPLITSPIIITAEMKEDYKLENIPHKINFSDADCKPTWGLVCVRGRDPLCLRCGKTGHIRPFCVGKWCKNCRLFSSDKNHICEKTFASVTRHLEVVIPMDEIPYYEDSDLSLKSDTLVPESYDNNEIIITPKNVKTSSIDVGIMDGNNKIKKKDHYVSDEDDSNYPLSTIGASPMSSYQEDMEEEDLQTKSKIDKKYQYSNDRSQEIGHKMEISDGEESDAVSPHEMRQVREYKESLMQNKNVFETEETQTKRNIKETEWEIVGKRKQQKRNSSNKAAKRLKDDITQSKDDVKNIMDVRKKDSKNLEYQEETIK